MTFIHPVLLGGIVLIGLPILLHLIMRQQPKHLLFPAFRFLKLQLRTNQRKLRLRHLLLLALRMLLIALMCLALARPRLFSDRFGGLGADQAAVVVLVIDTSMSMEYTVAGMMRLGEAKLRALELLDELGESSRVAVLDTGERGGEWAMSLGAARERIAGLELRAANRPVTDGLDAAFALLGRAESEEFGPAADEALPRFVYVFSDRTPASWENSRVADLKQRRDRLPEPKPKCVYIDVGVEQPADLAVTEVRVSSQVVAANQSVVLEVTVHTTGEAAETELICRFDGDLKTFERKPVKRVLSGQRITFERTGLSEGFHQAEIVLGTRDSLPFNDARFVTVEVRKPRKVLVLCDEPADAKLWQLALVNQRLYECEVKSKASGEVAKLEPNHLAAYGAVCLVSYNPGQLSRNEFWAKLLQYVTKGGGVAVALGEQADPEDYNNSVAQQLLPGTLAKWQTSASGVELTDYLAQHRLNRYRDNIVRLAPRAFRYWDVKPVDGANVLARYNHSEKYPAILERVSALSQGRGKVILFTSPMDGHRDDRDNPANDFHTGEKALVYFILVNETVRYLAGELEEANYNHLAGAPVLVPLPLDRRFPSYTLQGPGLTGSDTLVTRPENANELRLMQPKKVGQYTLTGGNREWTTQFSVNVPTDECQLVQRIKADAIEELFGPDSVVALGQDRKLSDALEGQLRQPLELFPWLMIALLLVLAVENLLANRFYQQQPASDAPEAR